MKRPSKKPTVLLTENIHPRYLTLLESHARVVRPERCDEESIAELARAEQIDAIVIRTKGCVTPKVLRASPNLKVVGRHGIGVDHIDCQAAARAGIWVVNTPGASRISASEHTWAMILALARNIPNGDRAVRGDDFDIRDRVKAFQLHDKKLGIIGLGRIGGTVAHIGMRGFGMQIFYTDVVDYPAKERRLKARRLPLKKLLGTCDIITIHTPLDKSTRGMIGARQLGWMQPHAFLVNCARGKIVDLAALANALKEGTLRGAALDVFDPEVPPADHPILKSEKVVLSPHFAAQTPEANIGYGAVVEDVLRVLSGKRPLYPVAEPERTM